MTIRSRALATSLLLSATILAGGAPLQTATADTPAANVTAKRLVNAAKEPGEWMTYGGTYSEQRFSALKQIDASNVSTLGLQWYGDYQTNQDQHGSPLYIDGVIYVSTSRDVVQAFEAKTGKPLWTYNPNIRGERLRYNVGLVNRGIAAWNGKIIIGTLDARLIAIDAKTGKGVWDTDTVPVSLGLDADMAKHYSITMAPRVAKGKVFVGASGGEYGVRGWIAAFDAETGKEVWRFWTVPGDPAKGFETKALETASKSWNGEFWKIAGGGGTVWDAAVYDPVTDLLYFGTGNASPWNENTREPSLGDDLYTASIVAVKPDTGEYVWHYQETPGDSWDYDAVSPMMTADLVIGGAKKHVIMQPSKNGFFYVIEAKSGKLLSADPFTEENWATGVDLKTGRPNVIEAARYGKAPWDLAPGVQGGHSWHPNAYSPETGLVYIPAWEAYFTMSGPPPGSVQKPGNFSLGVSMGAKVDPATLQPYARSGVKGKLEAWDPVARKIVWEAEPTANGRPTSGVLATAGNLVFMGNGGGKTLSAYDAKTGTKLWTFDAKTAVYAAPISYTLDGVQYVAASVGGVGQGGYFAPTYARMLVFALGGKTVLPEPQPYTPPPLNPPPSTASADVIAHGNAVYTQYCAVCHGANGLQGRSSFPNLTVSPLLWTQPGFDQVVLQGGRADKGMGNFGADLKPEDAAAVREFLISRANVIKTSGPGPGPGRGGPPAAPPP
jgi:quinohemoprotein ethanol dehydrogenase